MVVGSLDVWLTSACDLGGHSTRYSTDVKHGPRNQASALCGSSLPYAVPTIDFGTNLATPPLSLPERSLLTAQLRDSGPESTAGNLRPAVDGSENVTQPARSTVCRANSYPELYQEAGNDSWPVPSRDALSSPLDFDTLGPRRHGLPGPQLAAACSNWALEAALVVTLRQVQDMSPAGSAAGEAAFTSGDRPSQATCSRWSSRSSLRRGSSGTARSCSGWSNSSGAAGNEDEQRSGLSKPAAGSDPPAEDAGIRTSQKRNAYDGTVRGGHPRMAAAIRQPGGHPRSLADMLNNALRRV